MSGSLKTGGTVLVRWGSLYNSISRYSRRRYTPRAEQRNSTHALEEASQLLPIDSQPAHYSQLNKDDRSTRARKALHILDQTASTSSTAPIIPIRHIQLLRVRALARMNNIPESISILDNILSTASSVNYRRKSFPDMLTLEALTAFVTESIQHMDSDTLLNLLLRENLIKKSRLDFVLSTPVVRRPFGYSEHIKPLCRVLYSLPLKHAAEHVKSNDAADTIMAIANGRQSYCTSAQSIYELLLSRSLSVSEDQAKILMTNLIRKNETTAAKTVYYTLPTPSEEVTRVAHKAFARDGQTSELNRLDKVSITTRIFAFAENGDLHGALEMYSTLDEPSDRDKQAILTAYIRNDDLEGALSWVRKTPGMNRRRVYARLLSLFVRRIDVDSAMALDTAMREEGIALTEDHFTQLIKLYAKRRDIEMAERVVRQMIKEGVKPSTETWSALMNAATNANDWRKVVRIYQHISKKYVINTKIVNTLLKAYVMLGSPFEDVLSVIKAMLGMGIRADEVTFALAMQSACDMGRLDTAVYFLEECERWYKNRLIDKPNVVHYTLLIAAMLRVGHMSDAKFWYGKMKEEGVQPDSVTYGVIIASYLSRGGDDNVKIAKLTLSNLLGQDILDARANWMEKSKSKQQTLSNVLKPFIQNYGKRFTPQLAQETFEYMTEVGISVNIENLTMLMDGYRRVGNHAVVNDIWGNMIRIASSTKLAKNGLCLPLSIYIDSLTAQGRLDDLHEAFKIVRENGYGFDAHNWNHLAVGLNRLGDYYLAFSVVERILTVCESKSRRGTYTATYDDEPLDLIEEPTTNETIETEDIPQPNRASIRRSNIAGKRQDEEKRIVNENTQIEPDSREKNLLRYIEDIESEGGNHMNWFAHHRTLKALSWTLRQEKISSTELGEFPKTLAELYKTIEGEKDRMY
ncbi:hypothetical protein E3Q22_00164 [Wallemia mellicola]|uniref:PROP1-like PPR domain-containing protein n=1 Tax=Wallemia mellicola TaxID=1708541 RepID=A0A4T0MJL1_9BASI|nr:hypothetical protein E3Q22_00164 [Wallemia mellicola]